MTHHAALAYEAWNHGNLTDYLIEHARFSMAQARLWKMDLQLAELERAIDNIIAPC